MLLNATSDMYFGALINTSSLLQRMLSFKSHFKAQTSAVQHGPHSSLLLDMLEDSLQLLWSVQL